MRASSLIVALALAAGPALPSSQSEEPATAESEAIETLSAPTEEETPAFPSEIELVTVDVVVVEKKGRAVPGFTRSDFLIEEDG